MGVSTNGQICFGIMFEEGFEFPWTKEEFEGDIENWWCEVNGYENPKFCPYGDDGNYKPGVTSEDPRIGEYHGHRREWFNANPIPVREVNYCSGDFPMYILAIPETLRTAWRGDPTEIKQEWFVENSRHSETLVEFCRKYGIETADEPKWWLSSYWG